MPRTRISRSCHPTSYCYLSLELTSLQFAAFFLTAHFSEEDFPYDWLMLWLSRRPEWQRSREFETTTRSAGPGGSSSSHYSAEDADWDQWEVAESSGSLHDPDSEGRPKTRVVFQPTYDTTHTIFYRGHWLRVRRGRKQDTLSEMLSIRFVPAFISAGHRLPWKKASLNSSFSHSVVARSNAILKQLVLQAKKEYEAEAVHRIQIYFADAHGSWRWTDSRHKRPMQSIVLNPGVKEMLLDDARDFLKSEKVSSSPRAHEYELTLLRSGTQTAVSPSGVATFCTVSLAPASRPSSTRLQASCSWTFMLSPSPHLGSPITP